MDTSVFYSTMKDILVGEEDKVLLDEFVSLIRPEDSLDAHSFEEPGIKEDFPFNVDRKKAKFAENCTSQQVLPLHQMQQQTQAAITTMMPTSVLSCNQVTDAVNSAVESKVKVSYFGHMKPSAILKLTRLSCLSLLKGLFSGS